MAETQKHRRVGRAIFYGFLWGLGVVIWLVLAQPVIGLDTVESVVLKVALVMVGAIALSVIWAYVGPAKKPKGPPPSGDRPE